MDVAEKAYIAGFIDGEGSLHVGVNQSKAMVTIVQRKPGILYWVKEMYGGNVYLQHHKKGHYGRDCYQLVIGKCDDIRRLLLDIVLYLHEKQLQAIYMLAYCETVNKVGFGGRPGETLSEDTKKIRLFISKTLTRLNRGWVLG